MISDKKSVQIVVSLCEQYNIKNVVFSPGSRNAPLVISFNNNPFFNCRSIVDERSAAFYALGMAQQLKEPVIICCTSGSAALNYAPAISEAYYQNIPLIVLTADRPPEWIHHGEGQSIDQNEVYKNYIYSSHNLPVEESENDIQKAISEVNKALSNCMNPIGNPVHINLPFREPLYNTIEKQEALQPQKVELTSTKQTQIDWEEISQKWNSAKSKLILCGVLPKDKELNLVLSQLNQDGSVVVMTETTSNLYDFQFISCIDRTLSAIKPEDLHDFSPEVLVTLGGAIISKRIKAFLRSFQPKEHWQIGTTPREIDTFKCLSKKISIEPIQFINQLNKLAPVEDSSYTNKWLQRSFLAKESHTNYLQSIDWCDLKVFEILLDRIPDHANLQMGNSSPVRYVQLFNPISTVSYNGNRGVSGIDGSTSTTCGAAAASNALTVLISGDLSFVYDINAFWNNHLTENIRIIVINNGGGGIFRFIPGPDSTGLVENFFEVGNQANIQMLSEAHKLNYYKAYNENELNSTLGEFFNHQSNNRPAVMEIFTPNETNAKILKQYFKSIAATS